MWRCVVYVCFWHVLVVFVSGGWYSSYSNTQSLFTRQLSRYVALVAAPYPWDFIYLDLDGWILEVGEMLLSEEPPPWLGILAKSSLMGECVERAYMRWRLHVFVITHEFFSPYLHSWILAWWSERKLNSFCAFEERIKALTKIWLSSFSVEMCCLFVLLPCVGCIC